MSVLSIISSSKLIFNFLFSLSYKLEIKLNTFLAYKLEADIGNLFNIFASPKILTLFYSTILSTSVNTVFPPWTAAKS